MIAENQPGIRDGTVRADAHAPCLTALFLGLSAAILFPNAQQRVCTGLREMTFGDFEGRSAQEMADDPAGVELQCQFCLKKYNFDKEQLEKLLEAIS